MNFATTLEFTPQWEILQSIRAAVQARMDKATQDERDAAIMVASELVENAIKYGEPAEPRKKSHLALGVDSQRVTIEVSNGLNREEDYLSIRSKIDAIKRSPDPLQFYAEKIAELLGRKAGQSAGLGLYRIIAEGEFDLTAHWQDAILVMTAGRTLLGTKV